MIKHKDWKQVTNHRRLIKTKKKTFHHISPLHIPPPAPLQFQVIAFSTMTPPRLPSLQGYPEPGWRNDEMLCWCYSSRTSTSVLNLSQHNEVSDRLNNQPHTHTHIDTHRHTDLTVVLLLVSLCMWTVSLFLCFKFSDWSHLFGLLFCFSARITNDGWGGVFFCLENPDIFRLGFVLISWSWYLDALAKAFTNI